MSKVLAMLKGRLEARIGRGYPFQKLMLVESPLSFVSFYGNGKRVANLSSLNLFFGRTAASIPSYVPDDCCEKICKGKTGEFDDPEGDL